MLFERRCFSQRYSLEKELYLNYMILLIIQITLVPAINIIIPISMYPENILFYSRFWPNYPY